MSEHRKVCEMSGARCQDNTCPMNMCAQCKEVWPCENAGKDRITTREELDALPDGSVVRDGRGHEQYGVYVKNTKDGWNDRVWWQAGSDVPESLGEQHFPIEVLAVGSKP